MSEELVRCPEDSKYLRAIHGTLSPSEEPGATVTVEFFHQRLWRYHGVRGLPEGVLLGSSVSGGKSVEVGRPVRLVFTNTTDHEISLEGAEIDSEELVPAKLTSEEISALEKEKAALEALTDEQVEDLLEAEGHPQDELMRELIAEDKEGKPEE